LPLAAEREEKVGVVLIRANRFWILPGKVLNSKFKTHCLRKKVPHARNPALRSKIWNLTEGLKSHFAPELPNILTMSRVLAEIVGPF